MNPKPQYCFAGFPPMRALPMDGYAADHPSRINVLCQVKISSH